MFTNKNESWTLHNDQTKICVKGNYCYNCLNKKNEEKKIVVLENYDNCIICSNVDTFKS